MKKEQFVALSDELKKYFLERREEGLEMPPPSQPIPKPSQIEASEWEGMEA
jgi:hypothetical protein